MSRTPSRRPKDVRDKSHEMPRAFRAVMQPETPAVAALWGRYLSGDESAFHPLTTHYLPLARMGAYRAQQRHPRYFRGPLEELVSDGMYGLVRGLRCAKGYDPIHTPKYLASFIKNMILREKMVRSRYGRRFSEQVDVMARTRGSLAEKLGRLPTPAELTEAIGTKIDNPLLCMGHVPTIAGASDSKKAARQVRTAAGRPEGPLGGAMMDEELRRLVMRRLSKEDRRMLRWVLDGESAVAMARKLGVSRSCACQRMNGVLWMLRCRADLAAYLGVEPAAAVPKNWNYQLPAISSAPPARLAM